MKKIAIAIKLAIAGVRNHPIKIFMNVRLLTVLIPLTRPIPRTAPMTAWEVETGTPLYVYRCTVMASAKTTISAEI